MKDFIRQNPLIVASVALPLALIVIFALAGFIPKLMVAPPQYDLILADRTYAAPNVRDYGVTILVQGDKVVARIDRNETNRSWTLSRIYRYSHQTSSVSEFEVALPEDTESLEDGDILPIIGLENARISTSIVAPDGYEYRGYERGRGLMFEIFGAGRSNRDVSIGKDGAVVRIRYPNASGYPYGYRQAEFVGWVVEQ